ncbi:uncharacterized protein LOC128549602 [Mercenaria mercenaria]|uniref:uncharacterized protein LOC128549602 n=1 Tax=Mercenaria mercenaria TaxID=6596 RepID=UPI00234F330B|nr:uncharacterized protein LOC128549602 [Mercenaria mercenaria]
MPRRRNLSAPQQKRPLDKDEDDARLSPKKLREDSDGIHGENEVTETSSQSDVDSKVDVPEQSNQGVVLGSVDDEELELKGDNSGSDDEAEPRERSLSTSSTSEQRHRSLEALFQVTDTELQAISKQGPEGHRIVHIENNNEVETVYVIDPGIQEREELVGEPEVVHEEIHIPIIDSSDPEEEQELSIHRKRISSTQSHASSSTPQPSTSTEEEEAVDTPKWRQFKNIERILQNAGIDTSSKTWHTLTRPGRHICPYCQRACTKPSVLEKHIRAHTGERPYPCLVCGFSFKTKSNLYKHCKSRAHTLKANVEAKKMRAQGLADVSGNETEIQTVDGSEFNSAQFLELEKKKMEPAQRHVIQEVVKYLEKGKGQRPNEVQTERQRAKLERLKSVQEKGSSDLKKKDEIRSFQRQLSLPVLTTNYSSKGPQFQRIAPKVFDPSEGSFSGEVKNLAKILVPGSFLVNEKGEVVQTVSSVENVEEGNTQQNVSRSQADDDLFYNQIEIVNLPDPDTDPETSTKALHDLEELSEKFSKAAKDGLRLSTAVQSLPDKRVQVVLQLQHPGKQLAQKSFSGDEDVPVTPVASKSISSNALKERIQKLISANAAIVDTPKVEPPRAKCIKRNMSRQDSETPQTVQSETEAAVSGLLMPNISSVPLQPMALEGEVVYQGRRDAGWNKKQSQKIVVEKMEYEGEDVLIINNENSDDEQFDSPVKFNKDNIKDGKDVFHAVVTAETAVAQPGKSGSEPGYRKGTSQFTGKGLRAGLELPLTTTYLPVVSSNGKASRLKQTLQAVSSLAAGQPVSVVRGHKPTSSVIMSPMTVSSSPQTPGHIGKMALKNLQMKSRSLSLSSSGSHTPVVTQSAIQVLSHASAKFAGHTVSQAAAQYSVGTPGQAPVQYTVQTPSQAPAHYSVQTQGQTPVQYTVQTPGQVSAQYAVHTPGQGPIQYTVQTPGQAPAQYTVQTPGQAPTQYTIQTPGQAPAQFMVQTPGQAPTQYVLQTPTTPVAQVLLPGSSVPVLLLGNSGGAQVQPIPQPNEQQTVILQQTQQQIAQSRTPVVIQTPAKTPSQPTASSRTYLVHQDVQGLPCSQTVLTGPPMISTVATPKSSVVVAQSPLSLPSTQTDPMKILSSIVSNTVNQQRVTHQSKTPSQPKEIKIEIKLPPPIQNYGPVPQMNTVSAIPKAKPPLKRQNPVSMGHSPPILTASPALSSPKPVFRFKNVVTSLTATSKIGTPTIPSTVFRPQIASVRSLGQTLTTSATSKLPQTSVIKEFLLRGKPPAESTIDRNRISEEDKKQVLFFCPYCHISFKKKETLDLHVLCYCKNKNQAGEPAVQTGSLASSQMQTEIVSKMFTQSREGKISVGQKSNGNTISKEDTSKNRGRSIFKSKTDNLDDSPTNKKRKFELPLNRSRSVIMPPRARAVQVLASSPLNESTKKDSKFPALTTVSRHGKGDKMKMSEEKFQKQGLARKDLWQSKLKGQILKRKLKGKLLMNRSLSVDHSLNKNPKADQILNRLGLKTRFSDSNLYRDPIPEKKPRLVRSCDDTNTAGMLIKRPIFRRSKSVPEIPKEEEEECFEEADPVMAIGEEEENENKDETKVREKKDWHLEAVSVPINTADVVINSLCTVRPIYQQNFRMKSFEGMGTPVQLVPSATLTPRPELMEIEKVRKMFSFESGSLKLVQPTDSENESPTKSPLKSPSLKLPIILPGSNVNEAGLKTPQTPSQSPSKSPKLLAVQSPSTPKKSPNVHQFSLVGHTYPSMRSMTHLTFCCVDRLQPSYVRAGKKVSMYSNWRIAQQNTNPLGLATRTLLSLYNSRYSTNPVWVINCGADPRSGAITHSSYWKIKQGDTNVDAVFSLIDLTDFPIEKEKRFEVGYKTTEESVYVRGRGRGKYVCETCGIRCKKPSMLKKHIRTHTDLRPYKCKHCKFSFKTKGNLQKHMKSKSHYKKCLDLGLSPVPTAIDESQIDEEALQAQCYLSKRAKIVDKVNKSVESVDKDTNTTDDNDDDDAEDEEDNKVDDDGEDDDDDENIDESANTSLDMSVDVIKMDGDEKENLDFKESETASDIQEPSISQTQHNLFLQSLGIIAKQQLTGNQTASQLQMTGTKSLQLPTVTSLGISLDGLNHLGARKSVSSADSVSQGANTSSLSTVYGNFSQENEDEATVNKDSDVIWGLLNLSDQSHSSSDSQRKVETFTKPEKPEDQTNLGSTRSMSTHSNDLTTSGPRTKVKVTQALSFLPSYLSTASGMADTTKLGSSKSGPIIGQIIRNVTANSKANASEKSKSNTVFMPFQFQHPFPGTPGVVMSSSVVPSQKVSVAEGTTFSSGGLTTVSAETVPVSSKNSSHSELMYVQIGNTKGEVDTIQAQIVNIDPEVFKSRGSQDGCPSNITEIPLENVLQLRKVSEGLYVITSEPEVGKTDTGSQSKFTQPSAKTSASILPTSHVTGSASHMTGSVSHLVSSEGHSGRFVCSICRASFEEHHQLILHGNVHFLESSRLKCDRPSCGQKFRSHSALEKHLKSEHSADSSDRLSTTDSDDPRPYKCDPCVTAFRLKGHLTKHFRSRAHFKNLEALGKLPIGTWEKVEQKVSDIDAYTVEEFLAKVDILVHIGHGRSSGQSSWSQKDVSVEEDEVFIENDGSERVRVEVNEQPFEISTIGETERYRAFPLPGVFVGNTEKLESDVTQETSVTVEDSYKVKPHKCGLCGRGFETVSELKSHLITHAELRPYVCEYCDAGFTNAQSLKIHLYTHAQGTPYVCGMCGMKFPNISDLTDHCKGSHPPPRPSKPINKPGTATATAPDTLSKQNEHLVTMTTASRQPVGQTNVYRGQQDGDSQTGLTVEAISHSSQDLNALDVSIATTLQGLTSYNSSVESTLKNESDPKIPVVSIETKPIEVSEDSAIVMNTGTQNNLSQTEIPGTPYSTEHGNLGIISSSTVIENNDFNEVVIYLTEPLPNSSSNNIVDVESSEFGSLSVPVVSAISSDIVISQPLSHSSHSEHFHFNPSERDQAAISVVTVDYSDVGNETDPPVEIAADLDTEKEQPVHMAVDLDIENKDASSMCVPVSQEEIVTMGTDTSIHVSESVEFSGNVATGSEKIVFGLQETEKETVTGEKEDDVKQGVEYEIQTFPRTGEPFVGHEIETVATTDQNVCEPEKDMVINKDEAIHELEKETVSEIKENSGQSELAEDETEKKT